MIEFYVRCRATQDGHRYVEGHPIDRWEVLLYCQRCGEVLKVDARAWRNVQRGQQKAGNS